MERRTFMKSTGIAGAAAVSGIGFTGLTGTAAASSSAQIGSKDVIVDDSRGEVNEVWVQPDFTPIEWTGFDEPVGKIFTHIEARVNGDDGTGPQKDGFWPIFRMTLWSTPNAVIANSEDTSGPGPSGDYTSQMSSWAPPVLIADSNGRPDYSSNSNLDSDAQNGDLHDYLTASNTFGINGNAFRDTYHEDWGYFGPVTNVSDFEAPDEGTSTTTTVELRYTFAFQTVNSSMLSGYLDFNGDGSGDWDVAKTEDRLAAADPETTLDQVFNTAEFWEPDSWNESDHGNIEDFWSRVQVDEVTTTEDSLDGNSVLAMNGGQYEDITEYGASSPTDNYVPALQSAASGTPSVISTTTTFDVTVNNTEGTTSTSGTSNTGTS